ncbi:hypothetical protein CIL05_11725 [Virgibacillus profundi]|uniref:Negative regulator of sigma-X activity n=1 Tax=Virgibacillus profundi TaxID=2024555 RepID=A0A2A2IEF8_9BACI|nr:hypothetical protein [Virgibacillus profundi]PAV29525.1 hypothetical protein CIL05_11725 [Virgibacillus profundi]PXY53695.1 hypothetical protein CIT14_11840 [Virgibacillus profundi]
MKHNDDQELIEKLKNMPKIQDTQDKDSLYQHISSGLNPKQKQPKRNNKLVPVLGTLMAAILLLIMLPSFLNTNMFETQNENSTADRAFDDANLNNKAEESLSGQEESSDMQDAESEIMMMSEPLDSYVIDGSVNNEVIAHGAIADSQQQFVIPLTFVVPESEDIDTFYSEMEHYLHVQEWGVSDYLFKNVSFKLEKENNQVVVDLPADFSVGEGSATASIFEKSLTTMFKQEGIDKAVFNTENDQGLDLGPFGLIDELPLSKEQNASYKIYHEEDAVRSFLIPIPNEGEMMIDDALMAMKTDDKDFNVSQTIPDNINMTTDSTEQELTVTFSDESSLMNNQDTLTMIEAILMTAKSYGYDSVSFQNSNLEKIGSYLLTESIPVPVGANPINSIE